MKIDFISHGDMDPKRIEIIVGKGVNVAPMGYTEILLEKDSLMTASITIGGNTVQTTIPVPAAYLYLKGLACAERDSKQRSYKFKKDLWSVYFIAERTPENDRQDLYERLRKYKQKDEEQFNYFRSNLEKYFKSENSRGPKACERLTNMTGGFVRKRAVAVIKTLLDNIKD